MPDNKRARRRRRGAAGARERRGACRGEILTITQIDVRYQNTFGGIDDRE